MKNILLICSHYPPSNLTATHRVRLFAKHLVDFDWNPIILTVDEKHYEEELDLDLNSLVPSDQRVERVSAFKIIKPRLLGDVGIRGFLQLRKKAIEIIKKEKIDFIYIFIPSFYLSLLGPILHRQFGIKYGIDYIDPWVHFFPGSEKKFSRHWWSTFLSKLLEPIAVKHISLITGVSAKYYLPVFNRNPNLYRKVVTAEIPFGWDKDDCIYTTKITSLDLVFNSNAKLKLIYPGAFLPASQKLIEYLFNLISRNKQLFSDVEFYFIGTGKLNRGIVSSPIKDLAVDYDIYDQVVFEYPNRLPYLNILTHIAEANGLFILGSSEEHYTPSKLFNAFIVKTPIFAILNKESSGIEIIETTEFGLTIEYSHGVIFSEFEKDFVEKFSHWKKITLEENWRLNNRVADSFSIIEMTKRLVLALNQVH